MVYLGTLICPFSTKSLLRLHGFLLTWLIFQSLKKQCKQRIACIENIFAFLVLWLFLHFQSFRAFNVLWITLHSNCKSSKEAVQLNCLFMFLPKFVLSNRICYILKSLSIVFFYILQIRKNDLDYRKYRIFLANSYFFILK